EFAARGRLDQAEGMATSPGDERLAVGGEVVSGPGPFGPCRDLEEAAIGAADGQPPAVGAEVRVSAPPRQRSLELAGPRLPELDRPSGMPERYQPLTVRAAGEAVEGTTGPPVQRGARPVRVPDPS